MCKIVAADALDRVSSRHLQAITGTESAGFAVIATADLGGVNMTEAIELQKNRFCLGVQFHPEVDCENILNEGMLKEDVCDCDPCLKFFQMLVASSAANEK